MAFSVVSDIYMEIEIFGAKILNSRGELVEFLTPFYASA